MLDKVQVDALRVIDLNNTKHSIYHYYPGLENQLVIDVINELLGDFIDSNDLVPGCLFVEGSCDNRFVIHVDTDDNRPLGFANFYYEWMKHIEKAISIYKMITEEPGKILELTDGSGFFRNRLTSEAKTDFVVGNYKYVRTHDGMLYRGNPVKEGRDKIVVNLIPIEENEES